MTIWSINSIYPSISHGGGTGSSSGMFFIVSEVHPPCVENGNPFDNLRETVLEQANQSFIPITRNHDKVNDHRRDGNLSCDIARAGMCGLSLDIFKGFDDSWYMFGCVTDGKKFAGLYLSLTNDTENIYEVSIVPQPGRDVTPISYYADNLEECLQYVTFLRTRRI